MRHILSVIIGLFVVSALPSCLKDNPYMTVSNTQPIIEFGLSAANGVYNSTNGYYGAFKFIGDSVNSPVNAWDTAIALNLASPQPLSDSVVVTIAIDTTQLSAYNSAEGTNLTLLPANYYSMPKTVITIAPGYRIGSIPVTINLAGIPAVHQYGLPIAIVSAVDQRKASDQIIVSGNSGKFMWLFQP